jgi:hypothetical protein
MNVLSFESTVLALAAGPVAEVPPQPAEMSIVPIATAAALAHRTRDKPPAGNERAGGWQRALRCLPVSTKTPFRKECFHQDFAGGGEYPVPAPPLGEIVRSETSLAFYGYKIRWASVPIGEFRRRQRASAGWFRTKSAGKMQNTCSRPRHVYSE